MSNITDTASKTVQVDSAAIIMGVVLSLLVSIMIAIKVMQKPEEEENLNPVSMQSSAQVTSLLSLFLLNIFFPFRTNVIAPVVILK